MSTIYTVVELRKQFILFSHRIERKTMKETKKGKINKQINKRKGGKNTPKLKKEKEEKRMARRRREQSKKPIGSAQLQREREIRALF